MQKVTADTLEAAAIWRRRMCEALLFGSFVGQFARLRFSFVSSAFVGGRRRRSLTIEQSR